MKTKPAAILVVGIIAPLVVMLLTTAALAVEIKPVFTTDQAQVVLNLIQSEQKIAIATGNYAVLKQTTSIAEEILRAAQQAAQEKTAPK